MPESTQAELPYNECLQRLREGVVGRLSVVVNDFPIVFPVNYRLMESLGLTWVALRTRPGGLIEQAPMKAAFEIDDIDLAHEQGWSVLVRGTLHHVDPDAADFRERFDSHPWLTAERDAWMVIEPFWISGRRVRAASDHWAFPDDAYG